MREAAALRGRLDAGLSREELFPEPPLSLAFAAAEEHWIGELAEDLDRGHFERVLEYQTAYLEARGFGGKICARPCGLQALEISEPRCCHWAELGILRA